MIANTSNTCAIKSTDFEYRKANDSHEIHHKLWTEGMLRHVIAALQGARVAITTDNQTGHTLIGAKLIRLASSANVRSGVLIEHADGQQLVTHIFKLGEVIIPLEQVDGRDAKWTALDTYRNEQMASRPAFLAKFNGVQPTGDGKLETRVTGRGVTVSYQPRFDRQSREAEPVEFSRYTYRDISQEDLGILV